MRKAGRAGAWLALGCLLASPAPAQPIDRHALVSRHSPALTRIDPHAPLMLGNGNLGFTADITGLQTFPEQYSKLAPLLTMAQWAWHSFPNPNRYSEPDGLVMVPVPGRGEQPYPWIREWSEVDRNPALKWLRENPHRFSLGRIGFILKRRDGSRAKFGDLSETQQQLDLWAGTLRSSFSLDGESVSVETRVHPSRDMLLVAVESPLVAAGRIEIEVRYPGVSASINPDPSEWDRPDAHRSRIVAPSAGRLHIERRLDDTLYHSEIVAPASTISRAGAHRFVIRPVAGSRLVAMISFERSEPPAAEEPYSGAAAAAERHWHDFWRKGGAVDFSGSTDRRAAELERRVILSQYLSAINGAGSFPPQEEGLFSNSWNGKFHLEMHPLHAAHWAQWGRPELLERSLGWYLENLHEAKATARRHKVEGAWWSKMSGPEGRNSPSTINPFIMWQQPNPIFLAELVYRARRDAETVQRYGELVEETAKLLASWPLRDEASNTYSLGPPIIPVQENHPPLTTVNPAFELEFFRWGLTTAQIWRQRRGLARNAHWDEVIAGLPQPATSEGLYLPAQSAPHFWRIASSEQCARHAALPDCPNRDHPSFLMAWGLIAGDRVDPAVMRRTLDATASYWDLRQTWGWDFPVIAMTAARLGDAEGAIDWLFSDLPNNRWGLSGMTPRVHLDEHAADLVPPSAGPEHSDGPGYRRVAEAYFPANGSLLLAVGMMAAGWQGSTGTAPGFPKQGWKVRAEGIIPLP